MSTSPSRASASGAPKIPELMPILSAGAHPRGPETGACVMEYISFLAGGKWTDRPSCTNPVLAKAAQYVNDDMEDGDRQRLLSLLPRLMGTAISNQEVDWAIAEAAADYVAPLLGSATPRVGTYARDAQLSYAQGPKAHYVVASAEVAVHLSGGDTMAFLSHLIDAYDKATGRTAPATVTEDDLRRCAELTGASA